MRTTSERAAIRREIMDGVNDHDATVVEAIMELCKTLDELGERMAAAHDETFKAIDRLDAKLAVVR
jgi:hypothetical protein